ncbi:MULTISPECIES: DegT/DnrJ/EryC1/StrS family aminotransferase [Saccharothrix]|uniref:DegT/DnrJ/EryC1/StrS family aminotransferase n=1 Tax=Saccharothrix TaxID=2071 RepID=UPI000939EB61|nr:DegT/DnrJ/EryC1/StrS family aminotransferase [Saccharothrix sp. CB00851]OKI29934.1 glutamine--scyllo-inositol aminotransferase [Saccharothrix sp. CB00851]
MINLFQPQLGGEELAALADTVDSRWIGSGPRTKAFEAEFAAHLDVDPEHVLFLASGTASLFLAIDLLDLGPGDEVVLPSAFFIAAANAIVARGARPVFCDVDPRTVNPRLSDITAAVTDRTKAVVVLHYGGYPGAVREIADFCRGAGITLIEDSACSVASSVDGKACGTFGDLATWSFDAAKVLTTGDGGMLFVRDRDQAARARRLAYHGLAHLSGFDGARVTAQWWNLDVREAGRRVIGNDLTAAIGSVQLRRLGEFIDRRREIVALYDEELADVNGLLTPPPVPDGHRTSYYFYWVQFQDDSRDRVARELYSAGIYTTFRYEPLHRVPLYGFDGALPDTEFLAARTLLLPLHPGLTDSDVRTVTDHLRKAVESADGSRDANPNTGR